MKEISRDSSEFDFDGASWVGRKQEKNRKKKLKEKEIKFCWCPLRVYGDCFVMNIKLQSICVCFQSSFECRFNHISPSFRPVFFLCHAMHFRWVFFKRNLIFLSASKKRYHKNWKRISKESELDAEKINVYFFVFHICGMTAAQQQSTFPYNANLFKKSFNEVQPKHGGNRQGLNKSEMLMHLADGDDSVLCLL